MLRHSLKSIKPKLLLLACRYRFVNVKTTLLQILNKLRLSDIILKIKPAKLRYGGIGHSNSHLNQMVNHLQSGFESIQLQSEFVRLTAV